MDGENHFTIAPHPGGNFTYAKASYHSVYGQVVSGWSKDDDGSWCYEITIPANCSATISLPDSQTQEVGAGVYKFSSKGETQ
jgi:alpha-L-rhamnosidase